MKRLIIGVCVVVLTFGALGCAWKGSIKGFDSHFTVDGKNAKALDATFKSPGEITWDVVFRPMEFVRKVGDDATEIVVWTGDGVENIVSWTGDLFVGPPASLAAP